MIRLWQKIRFLNNSGQSLAETALFLPILVVMLLGIVEVSTLLINQNRVTTAGRIAAGYGAANFDRADWADLAVDMGSVARQTVTDTLDLSPDLWDIWSVYAQVNSSGTGFTTFDARHVFGSQLIVSEADWDSSVEAQVQTNLLAELQSNGGDISGLEFVVSIPYHDSATFLNLPIWQWTGFKTISDLTAMRVDRPVAAGGCAPLPIAVRVDQFSAYPTDWPDGILHPGAAVGPEEFRFPPPGDFRVPNAFSSWPRPTYLNNAAAPDLDPTSYLKNVPGRSFLGVNPNSGYIFLAREDTQTAGGFGWVSWDPDLPQGGSQQDLSASLIWDPDNDIYGDFKDKYPGSRADLGTYTDIPPGYGPSGNGDGSLDVGEWVRGSTGNMQSSADYVFEHYVYTQRTITLLYYDMDNGKTGANAAFRVAGFVTAKLIGVGTTSTPKWMLFELINWSKSCFD
jgi:hypothetical protein